MQSHPISTVRFASDVVVQHTGSEAVVVHLTEEVVFSLNATGSRIASLIQEGVALPALVDILAREYSAPPGSVSADVHALLETLASKRLVHVERASALP
jgi:hypothetical protein